MSGKSELGNQTQKYLQAVCSSTSTLVHSFSHLGIRLVIVIAVVIMSIKMLIMVMVIAMVIAVVTIVIMSIKMPIMAVVIAMVITHTTSQQDCIIFKITMLCFPAEILSTLSHWVTHCHG